MGDENLATMKNLIRGCLQWCFHTRAGYHLIRLINVSTQYRVYSPQTAHLMEFDAIRLRARIFQDRSRPGPIPDKLHFGCGKRHVAGWLNADVCDSEWDVDLACGQLPWKDGTFRVLAGEHVVEHLELQQELLPLLRELRRVAQPGAELWLSCPDMAKVCRSYFDHKGADLIADRLSMEVVSGNLGLDGVPTQQIINHFFHQVSDHKNLFDEELLVWALNKTGFSQVQHVVEKDLLERFPEFPRRGDDYHSIYVRAVAV